jgi:hypothetical protein
MIVSMLTTIDNPYNPFDDFRAWFNYDVSAGYNTISFLGRLVFTSNELSEFDQNLINEQVIDEIVFENITGLYKKVSKEFED